MRWSDGSLQLLVGDEVLDCAELGMAGDHHFLFLRHVQAQLLEVRGRRPPSRGAPPCCVCAPLWHGPAPSLAGKAALLWGAICSLAMQKTLSMLPLA